MIAAQPIGMTNTGVPLALLIAVALGMPRVLAGNTTKSQRKVAVAIFGTAVALLMLGAALFSTFYQLNGAAVSAAFANAPIATGLFFLRLSAMAAVLWGPVLALVWFARAHAVEKRRGEDLARRSKS